jgi:NADH-quinone oxidoreductase subunit J
MDPINWHGVFFWLFAAVACGFAVGVVLASNIVRMACCLVVSLAAVAGLFFLAGAEFLGAAQLMVYVGGTMVLVIFGVMLTNRGPFVSLNTPGGYWVLAIIVCGALTAVLLRAALSDSAWNGTHASRQDVTQTNNPLSSAPGEAIASSDSNQTQIAPNPTEQLGLGLLGVRADRLDQTDATLRGGMSSYLLAFEIVSVHLVVVLIGAAYLARARRGRRQVASGQWPVVSGPRTPNPESPNPESL